MTTSLVVPHQAVIDTFTGTWGADDNGFSADIARMVALPAHPMQSFLDALDGTPGDPPRYRWRPVSYPAQGFGINSVLSMDESVAVARTNGIAAVLETPPGTPHVISGYSQGSICSYLLAHEFLPGGAINRPDDLLMVINFGDPTCPPGRYPDGWGITRYAWDTRLIDRLQSYDNEYDMYGRAPDDTYLHIGFLALKQFKWDFTAMIKIMVAMIQNDEFVDALIELLPAGTTGLVETVMELTGHNRADAQTLISTAKPAVGGILGKVKAGLDVGSILNAVPLMITGFASGFFSNIEGLGFLGDLTKLGGGLLGGGSGAGGTPTGWEKMGKTFAWLIQFGITNAHGRYNDPAYANWDGLTAVDHAIRGLWALAVHL